MSVQIRGIEGCQGVAGRPKGEPGFPRGPGAEQGTLTRPFSSSLPLRVIMATSVSLLSITSSGSIWEHVGGLQVNEGKSDLIQFSSVQSLSCVRLFATP